MPLPADLFPAPDPADGPGGAPFLGARWACGLAGALLVLFALTLALRSLPDDSPAHLEKIVQQPTTPDASAAATLQPSEVTAPDPGDNPP